jgi:hypothetical protein
MIPANDDPLAMTAQEARLAALQSESRSLRQELSALADDELRGLPVDAEKRAQMKRRVEELDAERRAIHAQQDLESGFAEPASAMGSARGAAVDFLINYKYALGAALIMAGTIGFHWFFHAESGKIGKAINDKDMKVIKEFFDEKDMAGRPDFLDADEGDSSDDYGESYDGEDYDESYDGDDYEDYDEDEDE